MKKILKRLLLALGVLLLLFVGTALAMSPFFISNHLIQQLKKDKTDGYSFSYRFAIFVGAMCYLLFGLIGLVTLLKDFLLSNHFLLRFFLFQLVHHQQNPCPSLFSQQVLLFF